MTGPHTSEPLPGWLPNPGETAGADAPVDAAFPAPHTHRGTQGHSWSHPAPPPPHAPTTGGFHTPPTGPQSPVPQHPGHQHPAESGGRGQFAAPSSLDEVPLLKRAQHSPTTGWRKVVHSLSGGTINLGDSADQRRYAELVRQVNLPIRGDYRIAVLSLKGGVGKTTTTIGLGATLASLRGDRVIAVDANPDLGTLAQRVPQQTTSTVRDLIADQRISRYSDVRAHTSQAPNRLEVLASERDPATAEAFSEEDYLKVIDVLQRHYNIIITDCGTGKTHH